jgi:hypothetical protein
MSESPDPRALLAVLEAARRSGSRTDLTDAALAAARNEGVGDLSVRRTADAYADAVRGFTPPQPSAGYVLAALYAIRRRVAKWIGIPFVVTLAAGLSAWGISAHNESQRLDELERRAHRSLQECRAEVAESKREVEEFTTRLRAQQLPNAKALELHASSLKQQVAELQDLFDTDPRRASGDREKQVRLLRAKSADVLGRMKRLDDTLVDANSQLRSGLELSGARKRLDLLMAAAKSLTPPRPLTEPGFIYQRGVQSVEAGDLDDATQAAHELSAWLDQEREAAELPSRLDAFLAKIQELTTDEEIRKSAAAIHRQGRRSLEQPERWRAKEAVRQLSDLADSLAEEYTILITGGKWRYRNDNPNVRTYYLIVEAVGSAKGRLPRLIKNEETGASDSVVQWGERVPFDVYERIRNDKQDNGKIDQNVFGRKERGQLEMKVTMQSDQGEVLPRVGQITRW